MAIAYGIDAGGNCQAKGLVLLRTSPNSFLGTVPTGPWTAGENMSALDTQRPGHDPHGHRAVWPWRTVVWTFTRACCKERVVFLVGPGSTTRLPIWWWHSYCSLESENPDKDISFYINSPGGSVSAGMAIFDTMNFIKPDVSNAVHGHGCQHGRVLLAAGSQRQALCAAQLQGHDPPASGRYAGSGH